jgi:hypothetical protein
MNDAPPSLPSTRASLLRRWLNQSPTAELSVAISDSREARRQFLSELADRLTPAINKYLREQPQTTYTEKKALTRWLNQTLRELDLAVECPVTHMPATVVVTPSDDHSHDRFQLQVSRPGGRRTKTRSMTSLAEVQLTCRDAGLDKATLWQERSQSSTRPPSR